MLNVEALVFAACWALLAVIGGVQAGFYVGAALSVGLLVIVTSASSIVLSKTGDLTLERRVRWGILVVAAIALVVWLKI
jgi:hypothetical protein